MVQQAKAVRKQLRALGDKDIAAHSARYFKTAKGEYAEGDQFLGIRIPVLRKQVKSFAGLPVTELLVLLHSTYHEERIFSLLVLVHQFQRGDEALRKEIYQLYLDNTHYVNNWDLVDCSAHHIVGAYLENRSRTPLTRLAKSKLLWDRRISVMATYHFIRQHDYADTLRLCKLLINDKEDLVHKVTGWMLREIGNRDFDTEDAFLQKHYQHMPRTMLRYAIEKFPPARRRAYMEGTV